MVRIADRAATGDVRWLKIAAALLPYADAGNSKSLQNDVAHALPRAPEQVLNLLS